jgi:ribosomal protein S18 acetylase RimI-like enzyme
MSRHKSSESIIKKVIIRQGIISDLPALASMEETIFGEDKFSIQQIKYLLTKANADFFVMEHKGNLIGSAIMVWRKSSKTGRLYSIGIDNIFQGHGLGQALLGKCEQSALDRGCHTIVLEVRADNKSAISLYKKYGYRPYRTLAGYYADGMNGIGMMKKFD